MEPTDLETQLDDILGLASPIPGCRANLTDYIINLERWLFVA